MRRPPTTHRIKCHPEPFMALDSGDKAFEWRKFDRDYQVGDDLKICEFDPITQHYSGRYLVKRVTYMISSGFGIPDGYCIMSLSI